jgi:integrase/recombinase XerD
MQISELTDLLDSWMIQLRAKGTSASTRVSYREGVKQWLAWCATEGIEPDLEPRQLAAFTSALLDAGKAPATARPHQLAVRLFSAWLASEGEVEHDQLLGAKPLKLDQPVVEALTTVQLAALIKACQGSTLVNRRDEAVIRLMTETGARAGEVVAMLVTDVDLEHGLAAIRRGKRGNGRVVPFGIGTAAAIDRYKRLRRRHPRAESPRLWLGGHGQGFAYSALYKALRTRAARAGIEPFYPHQLRDTWASRWMEAGGSEGGAMAVGGWNRREMLDRYVASTSQRRAAEEARRLGLGEI